MGCFFISSVSPEIKLTDCDDVIILPLMKLVYKFFVISLHVYESIPNGYVIVLAKHTNL